MKADPTKEKSALCVRAKIDDNSHGRGDANKCQAYRRKVEQYVASIDFGDDASPVALNQMETIDG